MRFRALCFSSLSHCLTGELILSSDFPVRDGTLSLCWNREGAFPVLVSRRARGACCGNRSQFVVRASSERRAPAFARSVAPRTAQHQRSTRQGMLRAVCTFRPVIVLLELLRLKLFLRRIRLVANSTARKGAPCNDMVRLMRGQGGISVGRWDAIPEKISLRNSLRTGN